MQPGRSTPSIRLITLALSGWLWLAANASNANLIATVDKTTITEFEVLTLTVTFNGADPGGQPDFRPLQRDFEIVGQSSQSSSSVRIAGGRTVRNLTTDWIVQLRARQRGQFTIPPLQLGPHRSNPIPIRVAARSAAATRRDAEVIFFETSVDSRSVYVQAQLIYTVRLYWSGSITGEFPAAPTLENAVIELLVDENRYETVRNNRRYNVLEKQYAIFPQRSGRLTVPKEVFNGARGRDTLFNFSRREPVYAESKPLAVDVKSRPAAFPADAPWLPAANLNVQARWSGDADTANWKVGEPISRTLTMTADAVTASALPALLGTPPAGLRSYPDPPAIDEAVFERGIRATRVETQGLVPEAPGPVTIADLRIPWWNTRTDQLEFAVVPGLQASVALAPRTHRSNPVEPLSAVPDANRAGPTVNTVHNPGFWPWVALGFGLLWCVSTLQWFLTRQQLSRTPEEKPDHSAPDEAAAWSAVLAACRSSDAHATHAALRQWCHLRWGFWSPSELGRRTGGDLEQNMAVLDASLYQTPGTEWDGEPLRAALEAARANFEPTRERTPGQLAMLNPG